MKGSVKLNLITYITTSKKTPKILVLKSRTERINYLSVLLFCKYTVTLYIIYQKSVVF